MLPGMNPNNAAGHVNGTMMRIQQMVNQFGSRISAEQTTITDVTTNGGKATLAAAQAELSALQAQQKQAVTAEVNAVGLVPLFTVAPPALQAQILAITGLPAPVVAAPSAAAPAAASAPAAATAAPAAAPAANS